MKVQDRLYAVALERDLRKSTVIARRNTAIAIRAVLGFPLRIPKAVSRRWVEARRDGRLMPPGWGPFLRGE